MAKSALSIVFRISNPVYSNLNTLFASRIPLLASFLSRDSEFAMHSFHECKWQKPNQNLNKIISTTLVFDNWIIPKSIYQLKFSYNFYWFFLTPYLIKVNSQCRPN
ncbi:hypothetical protein VCHA50P415_90069 [Vibrio chagasii]|nr:hypothetical protein VCHA39P226_140033 [Vibrio chagasii]CAH6981192.1 hypothetical protein VCHA54P499_130069 [Vibrio chagasii]CAH6983579.1 hypothetical protein VCHA52P453_140070 [Vibrio chagasii]CAH6989772.1 hypothetical protein VCHA52P456_140035 [Vibrio chagasii]CAH7020426.1 hypothetical protein VCHA53O466_160034 [Vibrio chagasii]